MATQQIVLITGVSREMGLGFETSRQMAQKGYKVMMTARNLDSVSVLAEKLRQEGLDTLAMQLDTQDPGSVHRLAEQIDAQFGRLDVLINNAAAFFDAGGDALGADLGFVREAFETNLIGTWQVIQGFAALLRRHAGSRIVNVSSGAGSFTDPVFGLMHHPQNVPVYSLTKLALNGLTVKLARQLKEEGILVNAVCPGWVATYPGTAEWGARPVQEGASGIVWAATLAPDGPTGGFFRDGAEIGW